MLTRRRFTLGAAAAAGVSTLGVPRFVLAQAEPIRIGWLAALTGLLAAASEPDLAQRLERAYLGGEQPSHA
ncbi:MAG: hypothetical protein H0T52_02580 [Lautropia sp.]|nr:hypothetical protein [Lautropia sp.]